MKEIFIRFRVSSVNLITSALILSAYWFISYPIAYFIFFIYVHLIILTFTRFSGFLFRPNLCFESILMILITLQYVKVLKILSNSQADTIRECFLALTYFLWNFSPFTYTQQRNLYQIDGTINGEELF